jgi:hypothetical protein
LNKYNFDWYWLHNTILPSYRSWLTRGYERRLDAMASWATD